VVALGYGMNRNAIIASVNITITTPTTINTKTNFTIEFLFWSTVSSRFLLIFQKSVTDLEKFVKQSKHYYKSTYQQAPFVS
jgi:hypothetical protein